MSSLCSKYCGESYNTEQDTEQILNRQLTLIGQVYGVISTTSISRLTTIPDPKCTNSNKDLLQAAWNGNLTTVEYILQNCTSVTDINTEDKGVYAHDWTPLLKASNNGHAHIVKLLLQHPRIEVNKADDEGKSPLYFASLRGNSDIVGMLLQHPQIEVNKVDDENKTALFRASR